MCNPNKIYSRQNVFSRCFFYIKRCDATASLARSILVKLGLIALLHFNLPTLGAHSPSFLAPGSAFYRRWPGHLCTPTGLVDPGSKRSLVQRSKDVRHRGVSVMCCILSIVRLSASVNLLLWYPSHWSVGLTLNNQGTCTIESAIVVA